MSVTIRSFIKTVGQIELGFVHSLPSTDLLIIRKLLCLSDKDAFLRNFVPDAEFGRFFFGFIRDSRHVDRRKWCQLSLTDDCREFVTLTSVRRCLQHYGPVSVLETPSVINRPSTGKCGLLPQHVHCHLLQSFLA